MLLTIIGYLFVLGLSVSVVLIALAIFLGAYVADFAKNL